MTLSLIETKTLGSTTASLVFSSIPQTFTDLLVVISARSTRTGNVGDDLTVVVNSITSGYSGRGLDGNGSSISVFTDDGAGNKFRFLCIISAAGSTANLFSNSTIYIPNYAGSTNKSFSFDNVVENDSTFGYQRFCSGLLSNTAAITQLTFDPDNGDLVAGSTISLYGITKGSSGGVVVS
jgi:hypothetical protein